MGGSNMDLRGDCGGMPLELTGPFTGYNTGATMQVGLWIANDSEHVDFAQRHALDGPLYLRQALTSLMEDAEPYSAPQLAWEAAKQTGIDTIDWAQITYDLVFVEPDDDDLREAKAMLSAQMEFEDTPGESEVWELAYKLNQEAAERVAMRGIAS